MKLYRISFALLLGLGTLTSCEDKLDVQNPNQQTTATFGYTAEELDVLTRKIQTKIYHEDKVVLTAIGFYSRNTKNDAAASIYNAMPKEGVVKLVEFMKKFEEEKTKLRMQAKEEARKLVADAKREMEAEIVKLRSLKNIDQRAADRAIQQARDAVREKDRELYETPKEQKTREGSAPKFVTPGQTVYVVSLDKKGTVIGKAKGSEVPVQVGIIKLNVRLDDLREVQEQQPSAASSRVAPSLTVITFSRIMSLTVSLSSSERISNLESVVAGLGATRIISRSLK